MNRKELYKDQLQLDYFSDSYLKFEEDFYRFSNLNIPLTFLIDDILREMAMIQKNYFRLNKANAKDGREHYFIFKIVTENDNKTVRNMSIWGRKLTIE